MRARTIHCDYWPEPVAIITAQPDLPESFITIEAVGLNTRTHYTITLPLADWQALEIGEAVYTFDGPSQPFRLALEAVETLIGSQPSVSAKGVYQIVKTKHPHGIDNASYVEAVQKVLKENKLSYKEDGQTPGPSGRR